MNILAIIPARGGSKGLPGKNIRPLCGKPLICHSIDVARTILSDENICVSTDSLEIIKAVEAYGLKVPFVRPPELATDTATTNDTLLHALDFYHSEYGKDYDTILLLQPTSPLRRPSQIREAIALYQQHPGIDMVVSVRESQVAAVLCQENNSGYLELVFAQGGGRRQDVPTLYEYDGCIYVMNVSSLKNKGMHGFTKRIKYIMPAEDSVDIDNLADFLLAEELMKNR